MIVALGGMKGGTGKSTVATTLAVLLAARGRKVVLIDADPQETATTFTSVRNEVVPGGAGYGCVTADGASLASSVAQMARNSQDVVIDTAGSDASSQRVALGACDIYLVPFAPRSFDVWTLDKVAALVAEGRARNPRLSALAFLNRADSHGTDNEAAAAILRDDSSLRLLGAAFGNRKSYARAATSGLAVTELRPRDAKAAGEAEALVAELLEICG